MKHAAAVAILAAATLLGTAPPATADCNDTSWTWPFCHLSKPSIPRFNFGGPRPPLAQKNDPWCTNNWINWGAGAAYKIRTEYQVQVRYWPDYRHRNWQGVRASNGQWYWVDIFQSVDCHL